MGPGSHNPKFTVKEKQQPCYTVIKKLIHTREENQRNFLYTGGALVFDPESSGSPNIKSSPRPNHDRSVCSRVGADHSVYLSQSRLKSANPNRMNQTMHSVGNDQLESQPRLRTAALNRRQQNLSIDNTSGAQQHRIATGGLFSARGVRNKNHDIQQ